MSIEVRAQNTLSMTSVKAIKDATDQSAQLLATMEQYAEDAGTTLTGIYADAESAKGGAESAQRSANSASEYASRALGNLSTVQSVTETLAWITQHGTMTLTTDTAIDPTHVYFVVDANGDYVVNSTHYAIVTEPDVADLSTYYELTIDESLNNYVGTHLALTSEGLWLLPASSGTNKVLIATGAGSTYTTAGTYIIDNTGTVVASFRADGAQIGRDTSGQSRTVVNADGMRIVRNDSGSDVQIANLGYGQGYDQGGQLVNAPFYTLGVRASGSAVGNYSVAEGWSTEASGSNAHAEGDRTIASGAYSHAEGYMSEASGQMSHAEGRATARGAGAHAENVGVAIGLRSHAEGFGTAREDYSHAQGFQTYANAKYSHASGLGVSTRATNDANTSIGKYNDPQYDTAFEIGNGQSIDARSNALEVDWNGNLDIAGDYSVNGTTITDHVVEQGTDGMWVYRKWNSGIAECWGNYSINNVTAGATFSPFAVRTFSGYITLPSGLFISAPQAFASGQWGSAYSTVSVNSTTATSITLSLMSVSAGDLTAKLYAVGNWK